MACGRCGQQQRGSTALPNGHTRPPMVATTSPTRYVVNGKKFSTLSAAQDYAQGIPGAVIRQL